MPSCGTSTYSVFLQTMTGCRNDFATIPDFVTADGGVLTEGVDIIEEFSVDSFRFLLYQIVTTITSIKETLVERDRTNASNFEFPTDGNHCRKEIVDIRPCCSCSDGDADPASPDYCQSCQRLFAGNLPNRCGRGHACSKGNT